MNRANARPEQLNFKITTEGEKNARKGLKNSSAPGPDGRVQPVGRKPLEALVVSPRNRLYIM